MMEEEEVAGEGKLWKPRRTLRKYVSSYAQFTTLLIFFL